VNKQLIKMSALALLLCFLPACGQSNSHSEAGGATSDNLHAGSWDTDTRNNENSSLGAKSIPQSARPSLVPSTIDNSKAHENTHLLMNRDLADHIMKTAKVGSTAVAVTNHNIYVAVDMGGMQAMGVNDHQQMLSKTNNPESEAGLFGSGAGSQMDWVSSKPLPADSANAIRQAINRVYPDANVFISTNPHFVNRMLYYDTQKRQNKMMDTYLNEFNTMVQYTFPSYSTGQNHLMNK